MLARFHFSRPIWKQTLKAILKGNISIRLKRRAFNQCLLPVLTYGAEILTLMKKTAEKLKVTQRRIERSMLGLTLREQVRNEKIRRRTGVNDIIQRITTRKWKWVRQIDRMDDGRWKKPVEMETKS